MVIWIMHWENEWSQESSWQWTHLANGDHIISQALTQPPARPPQSLTQNNKKITAERKC